MLFKKNTEDKIIGWVEKSFHEIENIVLFLANANNYIRYS
jgi:hypothetical protein